MSLIIGARLGPYEILSPIGAGGMGEVYRARDSRLHREVALKVLPELFASDRERMARFQREAQVLASLNHPNIAAIHGFEDSGPVGALVLELVEGQTLAERLTEGPVPVHEALSIARQIADALEAAHDRGVVHRDLKPANVKVTPDGTVKVLDFGLAKALAPLAESQVENSPTFMVSGTQHGVILGTAGYMAPEQARGRSVDRRADIWAFGVVLYEMLTGSRTFHGDSAVELLASILEREPDWSRLPSGTPAGITRLLRRCLKKDPRRRLQSIGDARVELEEIISGGASTAETREQPTQASRGWILASLVGALIGGVIIGVLTWSWWRPAPRPATLRAAIPLPSGLHLDGFGSPVLALSNDGRTMAFLARGETGHQQLYVREMTESEAVLVPGSLTAEGPFFSPDGRSVVFAVGTSVLGGSPPELRKYSLDTRVTQTLAALPDYFGGVWTDANEIIYVGQQPQGLWKISPGGGEPQSVVRRFRREGKDVEVAVAWPEMLPNGRVLLTDWNTSGFGTLAVVDLNSRELTGLGLEGSGGRLLPSGQLVYATRAAVLMTVPFDASAARVTGTPVALLPQVGLGRLSAPAFAFGKDGTFAFASGYLRGSRIEPMQLIRVKRTGQVTTLPFEPQLLGRGLALSPDGTRLAAITNEGIQWIFHLPRGTRMKLPRQVLGSSGSVVWRPDGRRLTWAGGPVQAASFWGVYERPADGSGDISTLVKPQAREIHVIGWVPDGTALVCFTYTPFGTNILLVTDAGDERVLLEAEGPVRSGRISPDGRWLAFDTSGSGTFQVHVASLRGGGVMPVTTDGGQYPVWSVDGRELFFRRENKVLVTDVRATDDTIHFGTERVLFEWELDVSREWVISPMGEFYTLRPVPDGAKQTSIQIQTNWFEDVARRIQGSTAR